MDGAADGLAVGVGVRLGELCTDAAGVGLGVADMAADADGDAKAVAWADGSGVGETVACRATISSADARVVDDPLPFEGLIAESVCAPSWVLAGTWNATRKVPAPSARYVVWDDFSASSRIVPREFGANPSPRTVTEVPGAVDEGVMVSDAAPACARTMGSRIAGTSARTMAA